MRTRASGARVKLIGDFLGPDRRLRANWPPEVLVERRDGHMHSAAGSDRLGVAGVGLSAAEAWRALAQRRRGELAESNVWFPPMER